MKRLKQLLVIGLALVTAFVFAACDSCSSDPTEDPSDDPVTETGGLTSISVDTSNVKTIYYLNQTFDSTGLVVTAVIDGENVDVSSESSLVIDRSTYVSSEVGTYKIYVYYTYSGTTKSANYQVTVTDQTPMAGIDILVNDVVTTETNVSVTAESPTVTLSTDLISGVNLHEITYEDGTTDTALTADQYTATFYSESDVSTALTGDALTVSNGTYLLYIYYTGYVDPAYGTVYDGVENDALSSFVIIHINNPVTAIAVNSTGTFTQSAGSDSISSTWTYTVTYTSGATAQLSASDVDVTVDTITVGEKTATVSYTEGDVTVTCTVTYTITAAATGAQSYSINLNSLTAAPTAGTALIDGVLYTIGTPGYSTNDRTSSDLPNETLSGRLQINKADNGFKFVLTSAATITVYAQSSGSSARAIALYDYTSDTKGDQVGDSASVSASSKDTELDKCVFTTTEAGTYCLFSTDSSVNVFYIVIEVSGSSSSNTNSINLNSLTAAPTAGTALIDGILYTIGTPGYSTNDRTSSDLPNETLSGRLQINKADNGFKLTLTSAATITVYAQSSGSSARAIALYDYTSDTKGNQIGDSASVSASSKDTELDKCVFTTTEAGTYCIFSTDSSVNVFYIIIEF